VTDAELIVASRRDPAAFRELYDRWADKLLAWFYRRVLDAEVAADLLVETFAVAFERRHRFRDTGQPGAAWLFGVAAKELSHWFRHQVVERRAVRRLGIAVPALADESIARIEALADKG
jgi:RNA polymerase sigma-70 factor (ECF subfamily)